MLAEQGDVEAQRSLAYKYIIGEGVPKNPVLALQWYRRAADGGDVLIQYNLGSTYLYGDEHLGVIMDRAEAAKWYRRAAEQGEKSVGLGQRELGRLYEKGWGVPKDDVLAYMWYNLAAAKERGSFSPAASHRDTLAEQMTPAQIAEGQRLTREWKPKPETQRPEKLGWWQWALDFFVSGNHTADAANAPSHFYDCYLSGKNLSQWGRQVGGKSWSMLSRPRTIM